MTVPGERARLGGAVASPILLALTVLGVGALTPRYSQWADTVSRLGAPGQPHALAARAGIVAYGLAVLAAASLLGDAPGGRQRWVGGLIALYGACAVLAGLAPKDAPGAAHTVLSRVHVDATLVGGAGLIAAMLLVARRGAAGRQRHLAGGAFLLTGGAAVVFRLCWGSPLYGLAERLVLAPAVLWVAALARSRTGNYS